jgi:heme-degrading monooxygenase HmoA
MSSDPTSPAPASGDSAVLLHVWEVDPAQEGVALRRLEEMLGQVVGESGFVSARVLQGDDRLTVAVLVQMQTPEDRARLEQLPAVRDALDNLAGTVNVVVKLYREVSSYDGRGG